MLLSSQSILRTHSRNQSSSSKDITLMNSYSFLHISFGRLTNQGFVSVWQAHNINLTARGIIIYLCNSYMAKKALVAHNVRLESVPCPSVQINSTKNSSFQLNLSQLGKRVRIQRQLLIIYRKLKLQIMTQALPESTLLHPLNYRLGATLTIRLHKLNQILHTHSINLGGLLLVVVFFKEVAYT